MSNQSSKAASLFGKLQKRRETSSLVPARVEIVPARQRVELEGGGQATYRLRISNHRGRDYTFDFALEGVEASWVSWQRVPKGVKVRAGESLEVGVMIMPPRKSTSRAGNYPLSFVVRAVEQPRWRQTLRATLTILPYEALSIELHEGLSESDRWLVPLSNQSNQPLSLRLAADALDKKAKSHFVFQQGQHTEWLQGPLSVHLPAGASTEIGLMVTLFGPPKRLLWPATHAFELTASTPQKGLRQSVQGQIKLPSLMKSPFQSLMAVIALLCLLLLFLGSTIWSARQYMIAQQVATPPPIGSLLADEAAAIEWEPSLLPALEAMPVFVPANMSDTLPYADSAPTITLDSELIEADLASSAANLSASTNQSPPTAIFSTLTPTPLPTATSTPLPTAERTATQSPLPTAFVPTAVPTQPIAPLPTQPPQPAPTVAPVAVVASYNVNPQSVMTYEVLFQQMGAYYGLDWRLLASVAYRESRLNPSAVGGSGEYGLMQIMPSTWNTIAPNLGVSDPFDPYSNALAGTAYLAYLRNYVYSLGHSEEYWVLVAYNWGPNNVAKLLRSGGGWGDLPYIRQKYVYDIFQELNQPNSTLWLNQLKQPVPGR